MFSLFELEAPYFHFALGPANDVGSLQAELLGTMCKGSGQFISMYLEALQRWAPGEEKADCAGQTALSDGLGGIYQVDAHIMFQIMDNYSLFWGTGECSL